MKLVIILSDQYHSPKNLNLGLRKIAVFKDCKAIALSTQPPWLVCLPVINNRKPFSFLQDLQPQVKLKLLLSFFHIPRRNLEQWKPGSNQ